MDEYIVAFLNLNVKLGNEWNVEYIEINYGNIVMCILNWNLFNDVCGFAVRRSPINRIAF